MKRRVVVTGLGVLSACGEGAGALWEAAAAGRSHIRFLDWPDERGAGPWKPFGGAVDPFEPEKYITQRKSLKVMARDIQLAVAAAALALADAGAGAVPADRSRAGVIVGAGVLNHELDELAYSVKDCVNGSHALDLQKFGEDGIPNLFPLWLLKYLPNMPACHVSILSDLQGPNNTITTGTSSGLQAVGEAARILERGAADFMLCGAAESKLNPVGVSQHRILKHLLEDPGADPAAAYKVFSDASKGLVVGEGAAFVTIETLDRALARGARIYAEIAGFGSSSASGSVPAIRSALAEARTAPESVDYVQTSGIGIVEEDRAETIALRGVFGSRALDAASSKPIVGFTGFAAGAIDLALAAMAVSRDTVPATPNADAPPQPPLSISSRARTKKISRALVETFGLGGQSACAVLAKHEAAR